MTTEKNRGNVIMEEGPGPVHVTVTDVPATVTDPNQMTATQLTAHIEAEVKRDRAKMKVLRALLRVRLEGIQ
jgi:hypothetical protein